jgi:hypothetical protein
VLLDLPLVLLLDVVRHVEGTEKKNVFNYPLLQKLDQQMTSIRF